MRITKLLCVFLMLAAKPVFSQSAGPVTITSAQCAIISADGEATAGINVSGTWTGTLQPQGTIQGQIAFNVQVTPAGSTTPQSTITANGAYVLSVAGYSSFQVCGNTVATGAAIINLNVSPRGGGVGIGGATTQVQFNDGGNFGGDSSFTFDKTTKILTAGKLSTAANCAANGSAANPSVVACAAAAAGSFSCATAASTGTCTVSTTAVTTASEILITQRTDTVTGTRLSVTCNTGVSTVLPVVTAVVDGTSFTINLGTVTSHPECFSYVIVN